MKTLLLLFVLFTPISLAFDINVNIPSKEFCRKLEEACALYQKEQDINRPELDELFNSQLNSMGSCLYKKGKKKEAIEFWLLASSFGSDYGSELAGNYLANEASNVRDLLSGLSILRQLGAKKTKALNRYRIQYALAILKGEFVNYNIRVALLNLYEAMQNGSAEAAYLIAYFKSTNVFPDKNDKYSKEYWIKIGDKLVGSKSYQRFIEDAFLSDLYGASLIKIRDSKETQKK